MTENIPAYGEPKSPLDLILAHRAKIETEHPGWKENPRGELVRAANLPSVAGLKDQVATDLLKRAIGAADILQEFVAHVEKEITSFRQVAAEQHGVKARGTLGNYTLESPDALIRIEVNMGCLYRIDGGIADAKEAVHACIERWGAGASENLLSLATSAFSETEGGQLSRSRLGMLLEFEPAVPDAEWTAAMALIRKSITIAARKKSIKVKWRLDQRQPWQHVPLSTIAAEAIAAAEAGRGE